MPPTCTTTCTSSKHSPTCRQRVRRARAKGALREQPDQNTPAYLSDELDLNEAERAGVRNIASTPIVEDGNVIGTLGRTSMDELLACVERSGQVDGIIETAWALPLWKFRKVEEAWRAAQTPQQQARQARKRGRATSTTQPQELAS
jgi:hypothetical protein